MKADRIFLKTLVGLFILSVCAFLITFIDAPYTGMKVPVLGVFVGLTAVTVVLQRYRQRIVAPGL